MEMGLFGKRSAEEESAHEVYKVVYKGGHPDLPKAKTGEIRLLLMDDEFQLHPTIGSKSFWNRIDIPYGDVVDLRIVGRQVSTLESVLGGMDSRQLNQDNNIHIEHLDAEGKLTTLRFEMLTGITVQNQAKKCLELEDRLRNLGIRSRFRGTPTAAPAAAAPADGGGGAGGGDIADQIAKLANLKDQGILSDEEFQTKKAELLDRL
jgi:putative oligomerization/nucleic acid binding protein